MNFELFSFTHLTVVCAVSGILYLSLRLLYHFRSRYPAERWRLVLVILLLLRSLVSHTYLIRQGEYQLGYDLPFHLCGVSRYLLIVFLLFPKRKLFNVLFYWVLWGSILALLLPDLETGFPSFRFFDMFLSHGLSLMVLLYLRLVEDHKPDPGSHLTAFKALNLYALLVGVPANLITGGNYLFLSRPPEIDFFLVEFMPVWPWYLLLLEIFFYLLFLGTARLHQSVTLAYRKYAASPVYSRRGGKRG